MNFLSSSFSAALQYVAQNPAIAAMQGAMVLLASLAVFFVLFTARDILLRTHSFLYQIACIVLVAALPVVGFLLYFLIRPQETNAERAMEKKLDDLLQGMAKRFPLPKRHTPLTLAAMGKPLPEASVPVTQAHHA